MNDNFYEKLELTMEGKVLLDLLKQLQSDLSIERSKLLAVTTRLEEINRRLYKLENQDAKNK